MLTGHALAWTPHKCPYTRLDALLDATPTSRPLLHLACQLAAHDELTVGELAQLRAIETRATTAAN